MPNAVFILSRMSRVCLLAGALSLAACGGPTYTAGDESYAASVAPGTRAPADSLEEQILQRLGNWQPGAAQIIEGHSVTAGQPYDAASGRSCRQVLISGTEARQSLACLMSGGWAFVPKVFEEASEG